MTDDLLPSVPPVIVPPVITPPPAPSRPRVWPVFLVYGIALGGVFLAVGIVLVLIGIVTYGAQFKPEHVETVLKTVPGFLASMAVTDLVLVGAALSAAWLSRVPWRARLRLHTTGWPPRVLAVGSVGVLSIGLVANALDGLGLIPRSPVLVMVHEFVRGLSGPELLAAIVVIGVLPGIGEELLFRGYIQTRLRERWGTGWAILWTALLFGLLHLDLVQGTFAFAMGVFLGYLTERTGSIVPAMVAHAVNNSFATLQSAGNFELTGALANGLALLAGLLAVGAAAAYLRRLESSRVVSGGAVAGFG